MANARLMMVVLAVIAAAIAFVPPKAQAAVTCSTVQTDLTPCYQYVLNGGTPPTNCCDGIKTLYKQAKATPDRQTVCTCLKSVVSYAQGRPQILVNAASLPGKCNVSIPYKISPDIDCNSVH